jgi:hypothetical protein
MTNTQYVDEEILRFQIRCPVTVADRISAIAKSHKTSRNGEIVAALERHIAAEDANSEPQDAKQISRLDLFAAAVISGLSGVRPVRSEDIKGALDIARSLVMLIDGHQPR